MRIRARREGATLKPRRAPLRQRRAALKRRRAPMKRRRARLMSMQSPLTHGGRVSEAETGVSDAEGGRL